MAQNQELQHRERLTGLIATLSDPEKARSFERGLTISKIVEQAIPISVALRTTPSKTISQIIDIHLTKLVANLNLGQNLKDFQIKTIVEDLIDRYPNESIEDFIMVFKMARQNEFGTIYQLHSAVIFGWMEYYLDQKYQVLEAKLMKEKDEIHKVKPVEGGKDWLKVWADAVAEVPAKPRIQMTDKEIAEEGQEKPKRKPYVNGLTPEIVALKDRIRAIAIAKYPGEISYHGFQHFPLGAFTVFAKTLEDARDILIQAESETP